MIDFNMKLLNFVLTKLPIIVSVACSSFSYHEGIETDLERNDVQQLEDISIQSIDDAVKDCQSQPKKNTHSDRKMRRKPFCKAPPKGKKIPELSPESRVPLNSDSPKGSINPFDNLNDRLIPQYSDTQTGQACPKGLIAVCGPSSEWPARTEVMQLNDVFYCMNLSSEIPDIAYFSFRS